MNGKDVPYMIVRGNGYQKEPEKGSEPVAEKEKEEVFATEEEEISPLSQEEEERREEIPFTPRPVSEEEEESFPEADDVPIVFTPQEQEEAREFLKEIEDRGEEIAQTNPTPQVFLPEPEERVEIPPDDIFPMTGTGALVLQVTTATGALPVKGALVTVTHGGKDEEHLMGYATTNESGFTQEIELPTPPRELSEQPSEEIPFALYNVKVQKEGYLTLYIYNLQLFDGEISLQNVSLIPLMEFAIPSESYEELDILPQNL